MNRVHRLEGRHLTHRIVGQLGGSPGEGMIARSSPDLVGSRDNGAITPPPQNRADPLPRTRLKPSTYPKRRTGAVNLAVAVGMHQSQIREVVCAPIWLGK